eukprot:935082-Pleurochrysis_carterae.AAC.2
MPVVPILCLALVPRLSHHLNSIRWKSLLWWQVLAPLYQKLDGGAATTSEAHFISLHGTDLKVRDYAELTK